MRRPVPVAIAASALLLVLALPFLSIRFTGVDASVLPARPRRGSSSTRSGATSRRAVTTPIFAVVHGSADAAGICGPWRSPHRSWRRRAQLGPDVWEVRRRPGKPFLDGASQRLVRQMRALPGRALVGGATAQFLDQKHALGETLPIAAALLCAVRSCCSRRRPGRWCCR